MGVLNHLRGREFGACHRIFDGPTRYLPQPVCGTVTIGELGAAPHQSRRRLPVVLHYLVEHRCRHRRWLFCVSTACSIPTVSNHLVERTTHDFSHRLDLSLRSRRSSRHPRGSRSQQRVQSHLDATCVRSRLADRWPSRVDLPETHHGQLHSAALVDSAYADSRRHR